MNKLMLVNRLHGLDENYFPSDLVVTDNNENNFHGYVNPYEKPRVRKEVFRHFIEMKADAFRTAGIELIIDSGYRSAEYQKDIWYANYIKYYKQLQEKYPNLSNNELATAAMNLTGKYVAPPGHSEHQTGLAIDIACFKNRQFCDEIRGTFEAEWLYENASKFGFILRYPEGKEEITGYNFEPWHYRYVGEYSPEFYNGEYLTLEEYHQGLRLIKK